MVENTLEGMSRFGEFVVGRVSAAAKVGLVIGSQDGKVAEGLRERLGVKVYEVRVNGRGEWEGDGRSIWDIKEYESMRGLDFIVIENLHGYWRGEVYQMGRVLKLLKEGSGQYFVSFYNKLNYEDMGRVFEGRGMRYVGMGDPRSGYGDIGLENISEYLIGMGFGVKALWGLLTREVYAYMEEVKRGGAKGMEVKLGGMGKLRIEGVEDCFRWGARSLCVEGRRGEMKGEDVMEFFGGLSEEGEVQRMLYGKPEIVAHEGLLLNEMYAMRGFKKEDPMGKDPVMKYFFEKEMNLEGCRNVLVIGSGWGRELYYLNKKYPGVKLHGMVAAREEVELCKEFIGGHALSETVTVQVYEVGKGLPFGGGEYDAVLVFYMGSLMYYGAVEELVKEVARVSGKRIYHVECVLGAELDWGLKMNNVPGLYEKYGRKGELVGLEGGGLKGYYVFKQEM